MVVTARDMMNTDIVHLERDATVQEASRIMAERKVGCIIITAAGYPVGIISETDIVRFVAHEGNLSAVHTADIMSSPLFSTNPDQDLLSVAATMTANHIKKMPVMEHQRVAGIITQTDVVRFALHEIETLQRAFSEGKITPNEFTKLTAELFSTVPRLPNAIKEWHMRCRSCGFRFLADENKDGTLSVKTCPRCSGNITYDLSPPL